MADKDNIYEQFAGHLAMTGIPFNQDLVDLVKDAFSPKEARVALYLKPYPIPMTADSIEDISRGADLTPKEIQTVLDRMVEKKLIFCREDKSRNPSLREYALHYAGFGFPQSFFWNGDTSETAKQMSRHVIKYFNRENTRKTFGGTPTKPYRYIPIHQSIDPGLGAVLPHDQLENVIENAKTIAVAHCPCRVQAAIWGKRCEHPLEVCLKFDEMAEYVIDLKIGRRIDKEEARQIIDLAADAGLVHFVDNAAEQIKHNCNCCGCACWNVGSIKRRKIPRDELMAVYYIRKTDWDECIACEACVDICPVDAVSLTDSGIEVDEDWCIGCGVCTRQCPTDAISMVLRDTLKKVPDTFDALYESIADERKTAKD